MTDLYNGGVTMGDKNDKIFQALACMGNASNVFSYANNWVEDVTEVPEELKKEMISVNAEIHRLQDKLREIRDNVKITSKSK